MTNTATPRIDSTARLADVYRRLSSIDPDDLRDALLAITEGAPLHRSLGDVDDPGPPLPAADDRMVERGHAVHEAIIAGSNNLLPVHFLEEGVAVQRAVARVQLRQSYGGLPAGSGWGTGSLVSPSLLLTNNHVIPTASFAKTVVAEFNYQFDFGGTPLASDTFDLDPDSFFRTNASLDYTLVRVRAKPIRPIRADITPPNGHGPLVAGPTLSAGRLRPPGRRWGHLRLPAGPVGYAAGQFLNIVGHPRGRRKELALQDNTITTVHTSVIRYTTDTEPGSSGSPALTNGWDLVALHHAAAPVGTGWLNEGIRIDRIVADLRATAPQPVLVELGV